MNIYDFDGTIYDGDSSVDFFKFCLKKNKRIYFLIPKISFYCMLYLLKIKSKEAFKSKFFSFVKYFDNIDKEIDLFWMDNDKKIKDFYFKTKKNNDIIISASPEFLLKPISKKLNFKLIATKVDKKTGMLMSNNCYGKEKVKRLNELGISKCKKFYSDSLSDIYLMEIAEEAFIVNKDNIIEFSNYKESAVKKIKKMFFNPDFFTFVAIGGINALNGFWISIVYSIIINNPIISYIFGFFTSLIISYILNSLLNFKEKLHIIKFIKFAINNIPNFIIQVTSVVLLLEVLDINKMISYAVSTVIAVPITYVLIKINVFKENK